MWYFRAAEEKAINALEIIQILMILIGSFRGDYFIRMSQGNSRFLQVLYYHFDYPIQ